jgi:hypothetical protein
MPLRKRQVEDTLAMAGYLLTGWVWFSDSPLSLTGAALLGVGTTFWLGARTIKAAKAERERLATSDRHPRDAHSGRT